MQLRSCCISETVTFSTLPALLPGPVSLLEPSEKVTLGSQNTRSFATCSGVMKATNLSWRRVFTLAPLLLPLANQQSPFSFPLLKHKQEVGPLVTCFVQRVLLLTININQRKHSDRKEAEWLPQAVVQHNNISHRVTH